jgi:hypothetical protein
LNLTRKIRFERQMINEGRDKEWLNLSDI